MGEDRGAIGEADGEEHAVKHHELGGAHQDVVQLATFEGHRMIVTPAMSYLLARGRVSALDRTRYLRLKREETELEGRRAAARKRAARLEAEGREDPQLERELAALAEQRVRLDGEIAACVPWSHPVQGAECALLGGSLLFLGGTGVVSGG